MHTVDLLEQAIEVAEQLGYQTRQEWLGGSGGGRCEFAGKRWIFIDLTLTAFEQLEQITDALRQDPGIHVIPLSPAMRQLLGVRQAA
jgi:hypothetical protein